MTQSDYAALRDQLIDLKAELASIRGRMVTKAEWLPIKQQYEEDHLRIQAHHEAYMDWMKGKKWVLRIGIATLVSAWLSPHVKSIIDAVKFLAELGFK